MTDKLSQAVAPPEAAETELAEHVQKAWRPRVDRGGSTLHGFQGNTPEADSILESPKIRDPEEDTAPLQGSKDISDDDYLDGNE